MAFRLMPGSTTDINLTQRQAFASQLFLASPIAMHKAYHEELAVFTAYGCATLYAQHTLATM